jgi:purine-nucleoside phosphorylase
LSNELKEKTQQASQWLHESVTNGTIPHVFIQTGSGMNAAGILDTKKQQVPLSDMPGMPDTDSVAGHACRLHFGYTAQMPVLICEGRRHLYEGHAILPCVLPITAAAKAGVKSGVILSACGSINHAFQPGTVMLVTDYINNLGISPLQGTEPLHGDTFFHDMQNAFDNDLGSSLINEAAKVELEIRLGIYQANLGPQFETPAEVQMARRNGADVLGMSIVPETIAARPFPMRLAALALVCNHAADHDMPPISHEDVSEIAQRKSSQIVRALRQWIVARSANHFQTVPPTQSK